jgi:hypothetical protein
MEKVLGKVGIRIGLRDGSLSAKSRRGGKVYSPARLPMRGKEVPDKVRNREKQNEKAGKDNEKGADYRAIRDPAGVGGAGW